MLRSVPPPEPARDPRDEFHDTFKEFFPRLRSFFRAAGFQESDAEDLSQTALWTVFKSMSQFRGEGSLEAWIYTIARNVARDEWRRRGRKLEDEPVEEAVTDDGPSAFEVVTDRQDLSRTVRNLRKLPTGMRTCLLLHVQQGLSYQEIAARLSLSLPTVKVQIWNARKRLRSLLEEDEP